MDITKQTVLIADRKKLTCDAVIDVESFADDYTIVNTQNGQLCVEGENLRIEELSNQECRISISGDVSGVYFKEKADKKGFFAKFGK